MFKNRKILILPLALLVLDSKFNGVYAEELVLEKVVNSSKRDVKKKEFTSGVRIISAQELKENNIKDISDLGILVPSLKINQAGNQAYTSYSLRGVADGNHYIPSLIIYVDGVAQDPRLAPSLLNVKKIEILKGPQSSLYGKNSYSGVINIVTQSLKNADSISGVARHSSLGGSGLLNISSPLVKDKLYFGASLLNSEDKGNASRKEAENSIKNDNFSVKLQYAPVNNPLNVSFTHSSVNKKSAGRFYQTATWQKGEDFIAGYLDRSEIKSNQSALKASYDYDNYKLTYITSFQKSFMARNLSFKQNEDTKSTTQEIIMNYDSPNKLMSSVFGFYYSKDKFNRDSVSMTYYDGTSRIVTDGATTACATDPVTTCYEGYYYYTTPHIVNIDKKSYSLYGETSYNINSATKLTVGGRIIKDKILLKARESASSNNENLDASTSYTSILPKVGLTYDWGGNVTQYATINRGYKVGGFQRTFVQEYKVSLFKREYNVNYETGLRYETPNKDLSFDGSVYYNNMNNTQFYEGDPGAQVVVNKNSKSYGVDLNATIHKIKDIDFIVGVQYNKSSISGSTKKQTPYVPVLSGNLGVRHYLDMSKFNVKGDLITNLNIFYTGKSYLDLANNFREDSYALVNLRTTYKTGGLIDVSLFANNIFDKAYRTYAGGTSPNEYIQIGKRRDIGIEFMFKHKF
ncbi:MAG: TonB-dependent receptor [Alphaproteobacteria bacterium]|nr:TonB-dependent receptor [Alphaproteobacteria bacterium]